MIRLSVIVPMRNEGRYIEACLKSLLGQTIPADSYEIIVVDGCSSDNTVEIVRNIQRESPNVFLLHNTQRIMPVAMNMGIRVARGEIITVAGSHTSYPSDYLETSLFYLNETKADVVGGPITTMPANQNFVSRMCAAILGSRFGVGNAKFRTSLKEGFVDTVPFGSYRRAIFERCGYYNETLVRGQDRELNTRIVAMGGRIYQTPALITEYYSVARFGELLTKAFHTGWWQASIIRENKETLGIRHLVPCAFVVILLTLSAASFAFPWATWFVAFILLFYAGSAVYFAGSETTETDLALRLSMPFFTLPFHACYGIGTLVGFLHALEPAKRAQPVPLSSKSISAKEPVDRISDHEPHFEESISRLASSGVGTASSPVGVAMLKANSSPEVSYDGSN